MEPAVGRREHGQARSGDAKITLPQWSAPSDGGSTPDKTPDETAAVASTG